MFLLCYSICKYNTKSQHNQRNAVGYFIIFDLKSLVIYFYMNNTFSMDNDRQKVY